ncbi:MAG: transcriptional regulator [Paludibacteraceae bacterium]|nr:transcriptional regulator [Paludibacteraceae bacterium]
MEIDLKNINKAFESKVRLGIMSALMVNEELDFSTLKSLMELTDGNLASHTRSLEEMGYIESKKQFIGRKPNTTFHITENGRKAFTEHLNALEQFLKISMK